MSKTTKQETLPATREQTFTITPAEMQAVALFASKSPDARHLYGVHLTENTIIASDGLRYISIAYLHQESETDEGERIVTDHRPQGFFQPVTLPMDFVWLFIEASSIAGNLTLPVKVRVYEKSIDGELPMKLCMVSALGIERECIGGEIPSFNDIVPAGDPTCTPSNMVDARHYLDGVKARNLIVNGKPLGQKDRAALQLKEWGRFDKKLFRASPLCYINADERLEVVFQPVLF